MEVRILVAIIAAPSVVDVVLPDDELAVNVDVVVVLLAVQVAQFAMDQGGCLKWSLEWWQCCLPWCCSLLLSMPSWWSWCRADDLT